MDEPHSFTDSDSLVPHIEDKMSGDWLEGEEWHANHGQHSSCTHPEFLRRSSSFAHVATPSVTMFPISEIINPRVSFAKMTESETVT
ncbi:hypothetical protein VTJ49DRAFT_935 [Mycothermus thermophilus]|uniref:Uncharacterized protein n=1 Tax=Humicola insolens TaxID=85995 RepID=A0ABR3VFE9_HUMIN